MKYEAVTRDELVRQLGRQCSPDPRREGYVIGPDVHGRRCHVATMTDIYSARRWVDRANMKAAENE